MYFLNMKRVCGPGGLIFLLFFLHIGVPQVGAEEISVQPGLAENVGVSNDYSVLLEAQDGRLWPYQDTGMMLVSRAKWMNTLPEDDYDDIWAASDSLPTALKDPFEPFNRAFFLFNDKLYFWVLKPLARGYRAAVPKTARMGVSNFFYNLAGPVRLVNCILQGKGQEAGYEFVRLFMNTTVGLGGLLDVAGKGMDLDRYNEDLGQTLGVYGLGPSFYVHWPVLGPSSGRDTLGMLGDAFLRPVYYIPSDYSIAVRAYERINETSFTIGDYESLKRSALDPYVAVRDAYHQYRENMVGR